MDYFRKKKVVLAGVGKWGLNHLKTLAGLLPKGSLGFYEPDKNAKTEASKTAPSAYIYDTFEDILKDESVVAVVIAAPANLHFPLALETVRAKKHVFVEKPLAMKVAEGVSLVKNAERKGVTLAVGHILLFDPAYEKLKRMVNRGDLGDVFYIYAARAKLGTVRVVEDVIFSLASHDIAMVLGLLGKRPSAVSCVGTNALRNEITDAAVLSLTFEDGIKAYVFTSWLHPTSLRRMTVVGSKASAIWDETSGERLRLLKKGATITSGGPELYDQGAKVVNVPDGDLLKTELTDFLRSVKSGEEPKCSGRYGLAVLEVLSAAQKSVTTGGGATALETGALY
jgi:UDP-2-acetamido-3-amino-2,3-dideoxy-glucuronate N-acetyltransferase